MVTIASLLRDAQTAVLLAQQLPIGDVRITQALRLLNTVLDTIQHAQEHGLFRPDLEIKVEDIGVELDTVIQAALAELAVP